MNSALSTKVVKFAMMNFDNAHGARGSFHLNKLTQEEEEILKQNVKQIKYSWVGMLPMVNCHWNLLEPRDSNSVIVIVYFHDQKKGFPDLGNIVIDACELTEEALKYFTDYCNLQVNKTVGETIVKKTVAKTIVKKHSAKSYSDAAAAGATANTKMLDNESNILVIMSNARTDEENAAKEVDELERQLVQAKRNSETVKNKSLEIQTKATNELVANFLKTKKILQDLGIDPEPKAEAELTSPTSVAMISSKTQLDEN
jgi:hypothetical protein